MSDDAKKPETPNLVRFSPSGWRPVFGDVGGISDGKGQFLKSISSPIWNRQGQSGCLETDAQGHAHLVVRQIEGFAEAKNVVEHVLGQSQFGLGNNLRSIRSVLTVESTKLPESIAFAVDGIKSATGLDPKRTVMDEVCASPVLQGLRKKGKDVPQK